jgi:hypothetical protein
MMASGEKPMTNTSDQDAAQDWLRRWRVARVTVATVLSWIVALPLLGRLMRWRREKITWVQDLLGALSGLIWGRIGWVGVRRYGFSNEDAFLAGGLAGAVAPTFTLTLRRLGWKAGLDGDRPRLSVYPFAWLQGFLLGGLMAALGALVARLGRPRLA